MNWKTYRRTATIQSDDDIIGLRIRSRELGLDRYRNHCQTLKFLEIDPEDHELRELALEDIQQAEAEEILNPDPFRATNPVSPHNLMGDVGIGLIPPRGVPWSIPKDMLTNHLLVAGRSGGGKTNLILLILAQLLEMQKC